MTGSKRFFIGGLGALMPITVSALSLDMAVVVEQLNGAAVAVMAGIAFRYVILFGIGGLVAYLHSDETKLFKLFEIGIAAPALITSLVASNAHFPELNGRLNPAPEAEPVAMMSFSLFPAAHAGEVRPQEKGLTEPDTNLAQWFRNFSSGVTGSYKRVLTRPDLDARCEDPRYRHRAHCADERQPAD